MIEENKPNNFFKMMLTETSPKPEDEVGLLEKEKEQLAEDKVNLTLKNNDLSNSLSKTRLYLIGLIILIAVYFYVKTQKLF